MSAGAAFMGLVTLVVAGTLAVLIFSTARSIHNERTADRPVWRDFGLSLLLMTLFFATWVAQGVAQWQTFTDHQRAQGLATSFGDFVSEFGQATLENWQSEFLQLFSFVTLAALYIHKGSAESKDGEARLEASLRRIEEKLGTLPDDAPREPSERSKLPDTPLELSG
jgi:hypothetical protein